MSPAVCFKRKCIRKYFLHNTQYSVSGVWYTIYIPHGKIDVNTGGGCILVYKKKMLPSINLKDKIS